MCRCFSSTCSSSFKIWSMTALHALSFGAAGSLKGSLSNPHSRLGFHHLLTLEVLPMRWTDLGLK